MAPPATTRDAVIYFNVADLVRAVVDVQDYTSAIGQVAPTSLRSIIGKSDLDALLSNREGLNRGLQLEGIVGQPFRLNH
jgi:regulator of protease activity HflC (stomatin/prohibitin superfamily)